ncbi:MAG: hypothetical protein PVJ19_21325 [Desulfobacteraceae bacterium]|jgi:hypothetical protein
MKNVTKYALIVVVPISLIALSIALWPQPRPKPDQQPQTAAADSGDKHDLASYTCVQNRPFATAYKVHTTVESKLDQQMIYRSQLDFRIQLQQGRGDDIFGAATDIAIREATAGRDMGEPRPMEDVLFLTGAETGEHTVFSKFNDLGLMKQHPMAIVSQLLKNLSVGDQGRVYRFSYDQLQREYLYRVANGSRAEIRRDLLVASSAASPPEKLHPLWEATVDEQCLPKSLQAEEILPIGSAGRTGSVRFIMQAERIADYMDLSQLDFTARANQKNRWEVAMVKRADIAPKITSEQEMWDTFKNFQQTRNAAGLARAAEYLVEHLPSDELVEVLTQGNLADDEIRDMIFGLGLTSRHDAEDYMVDTLVKLPVDGGDDTDLLKIRLMVALSGNGMVTDKAYDTLSSISNDVAECSNVRRNALINMGSTVRQMQSQGQDISAVSDDLETEIISAMQGDASAAIFSAGNVGLENLTGEVTQWVVDKLQSANQKERYASARVLRSDTRHYDTLIDHLAGESSVLVGMAIASGLQGDQLTGEQRTRLQEIGISAPRQVRHEIEKLLGV